MSTVIPPATPDSSVLDFASPDFASLGDVGVAGSRLEIAEVMSIFHIVSLGK